MSKRGWILVFLVAIGLVVWAALLLRSPEPQASQAAAGSLEQITTSSTSG